MREINDSTVWGRIAIFLTLAVICAAFWAGIIWIAVKIVRSAWEG